MKADIRKQIYPCQYYPLSCKNGGDHIRISAAPYDIRSLIFTKAGWRYLIQPTYAGYRVDNHSCRAATVPTCHRKGRAAA